MKRYRLTLTLLVLLVGLIVYFGWPRHEAPLSIKLLYCPDLIAGCGDGRVQLRFKQEPKVLQPFEMTLSIPDAKEVHASFAMQDMEMGLNRYRFVRQADGQWLAKVTLPVCVQGRSDWQAILEAETSAGTERFQFAFSAAR